MNTWQETSKLVELRTKTDRQLVELISHKLETATRLAQVREFHGVAEQDCAEVSRLLAWVSRPDRRRLEARLREVTAMLRPTQCAACF
jgi:hypothetical protein